MHFHIIPKDADGRGLGTTGKFWRSHPIDKDTAAALADKISAIITGSGAGAGGGGGGGGGGDGGDGDGDGSAGDAAAPDAGAEEALPAATSL